MMTTIGNLNPYSYNSFATGGATGKLYVPVNPGAVIYAQFDHISGVAANSGQYGVSISKLQILNSLIDGLSALKNKPKSDVDTTISDRQADVLIKQYQQQMAQALLTPAAPYILSGAQPVTGGLFSFNA
jgi:hypothetical protein